MDGINISDEEFKQRIRDAKKDASRWIPLETKAIIVFIVLMLAIAILGDHGAFGEPKPDDVTPGWWYP